MSDDAGPNGMPPVGRLPNNTLTAILERAADAAEQQTPEVFEPLAPVRPGCPTHRTRKLMTQAVDEALLQNMSYIDQLIGKLQDIKNKLADDSGVVKAAIHNHYSFAAEALAFADLVEERLVSIGRNGGNNDEHWENEATIEEVAPADRDSGGNGFEPFRAGRTREPME